MVHVQHGRDASDLQLAVGEVILGYLQLQFRVRAETEWSHVINFRQLVVFDRAFGTSSLVEEQQEKYEEGVWVVVGSWLLCDKPTMQRKEYILIIRRSA